MAKWIIDPNHTVAHFLARHMMITDVHGQFNDISGTIEFNQQDVAATSAEVEINAAGIWTGVERRDNHLRSPDFLNVEKYKTIFFKSTRTEMTGISTLKLHGTLTIRGITRPVILDTEFFGPNHYEDEEGVYDTIGFSATTSLNREDFDMTWNNYFGNNNFMVGKHINITLNAEADLAS